MPIIKTQPSRFSRLSMFLIFLLLFFLTPFIFPLLLPVCLSMIVNNSIISKFKKDTSHSITCSEWDQNSSINTTDLSFIKPKCYQIRIIKQSNCNFVSVLVAILAYPFGLLIAAIIVPLLMVGLVIFMLVFMCMKKNTSVVVNKMK
jgi:hypothetical protein